MNIYLPKKRTATMTNQNERKIPQKVKPPLNGERNDCNNNNNVKTCPYRE